MNGLLLNDILRVPCPDGFHVMDDAERSNLEFIVEGPGVCLSDPERHIIVSIGYKKTSGFAAMLVSEKDAAKNMETQIGTALRSFGYRLDGFAARMIGGKTGTGSGYHYVSGDTGMYGESFVVKQGKVFYYFHYYTREALIDENFPVWSGFLSEIRWEA